MSSRKSSFQKQWADLKKSCFSLGVPGLPHPPSYSAGSDLMSLLGSENLTSLFIRHFLLISMRVFVYYFNESFTFPEQQDQKYSFRFSVRKKKHSIKANK